MCVSVSTEENKPLKNPLSQVVDSSHSVILGKAQVRKWTEGKHLFTTAQVDKRSLELQSLLQMGQHIIMSCI